MHRSLVSCPPRYGNGLIFSFTFFFVAFLPQFLDPAGDVRAQLWLLSITFVALATVNATLYAVFAGTARRILAAPRAQRRFNMAGGTLLTAAGFWVLLARRTA